MISYKQDLFTIDLICLDVILENETCLKINEETKGWFVFVEKSKQNLNFQDMNWEMTVANPAFEKKTTIIYDKEIEN